MSEAFGAPRGSRVAIVRGLRTPFARQGTAYRDLSALDLGKLVVAELIQRAELDPREIGACVFGQVLASIDAPNVAREVVLGAGLPRTIEAFSVSRGCATSLQSMTSAAEAMLAGQHDVVIAGGADSASAAPVRVSDALARALFDASKAKTWPEKLRRFRHLSPHDLHPVPPSMREPSTGLSLGEHAEKMAKEAGISRSAQDALAHESHVRAAAAWRSGVFNVEVMHVVPPPAYDRPIARDNLVREDSSLEERARQRPAFDRRYGTVTAGSSSHLADGAAALLLMTEAKARALGFEPLGYLRSWSYAAVDPRRWLLMGPAHATPLALDRAGLSLRDIDVVEMHEAFAAQVLCNVRAFASRQYAVETLGRAEALGELDPARLNIHGGSIALGHPFAATGARLVTTALHELRRKSGRYALVTASAAGGLGAAAVLEVGP